MISFSNINGQFGKQLLFVDASFQLNPGEKVGLVGSNGFQTLRVLRSSK
jgi:ATPase subunit of ABC transporter with duplicated ATPase domains